MIDKKFLESKNYCWLEEVSDTGLRDDITRGKQYKEVTKFFEPKKKEIEEKGYIFEDFIDSLVKEVGTIHVIKKEKRIIKKLVYVENVNSVDWDTLILKDLNDKSIFIIPENPL